jgi:protoporphyrinogen oxidase
MMWEVCREKIEQLGGTIYMGSKVTECHWDEHLGLWSITSKGKDGEIKTFAHHLISSAPLRELVHSLTPELPESVQKAASGLRYRDFLTVMLILKDRNLFSDNWIYIHDPEVKVGRIQNFKSWSPEMVPDQSFCCYGLEYFCFEGDGLWNSTDEELINLAKQELEKIGLAAASDVLDGCVVRQPKAYPVYDDGYSEAVNRIRVSMEEQFPTLHLVGRNGMHKYNNQDHAMMTAILCSKNILAGEKIYDVWNVNQDAEYHEESKEQQSGSSGLRAVPERVEEVEPVSSGIYRK